jgi:hypothetical protein
MSNKLNLLNQKFGLLTAIEDTQLKNSNRVSLWECVCDCGNKVTRPASELTRGKAWSCGCTRMYSHTNNIKPPYLPKKGSPTHNSWRAAKERVRNIESYRVRGMCKGLKNSFYSFYSLVGERPPHHSIDRIDNDLGYYCGGCSECREKGWPMNIRWATEEQQSLNNGQTRLVYIKGKPLSITRAAQYLKVDRHRLSKYLSTKGDIESFILERNIDLENPNEVRSEILMEINNNNVKV